MWRGYKVVCMVDREGRMHGRVWELVCSQNWNTSKVELAWGCVNYSTDANCLDLPDLVDKFDQTLLWEWFIDIFCCLACKHSLLIETFIVTMVINSFELLLLLNSWLHHKVLAKQIELCSRHCSSTQNIHWAHPAGTPQMTEWHFRTLFSPRTTQFSKDHQALGVSTHQHCLAT